MGPIGIVIEILLENIGSNTYQLVKLGISETLLLDAPNMLKYLPEHKPAMVMHVTFVLSGINANITTDVRFLLNSIEIGFKILMSVKGSNLKKFISVNGSRTFLYFCRKHTAKLRDELEKTDQYFRNKL